jgi:hypothetical protein
MKLTALLLAITITSHAEVIRYYLHDATIGDDPRHAVNAAVSGEFDFDTVTGAFFSEHFSFHDNGYGTIYTVPFLPGEWLMIGSPSQTDALFHFQSAIVFEKYTGSDGQVQFLKPLDPGTQSAAIDLANSFVRFFECVNPLPDRGGCLGGNIATIYFTAGYVSTANPEPSTLLLSATCASLLAWRMRRMRRQWV